MAQKLPSPFKFLNPIKFMTNLSSMFDEIKDRYRNPFFGSFILAWFIWNWKIWVGLIWFDKDQLASASASNYSQYIENNLSISSGLWYPLISALGIVILFPIIKNLISMYQTFSANWGEKGIIKISKSGFVTTEFYLKKKHDLTERVRRIESAAEEEEALLRQLSELTSEKSSIEQRFEDLNKAYEILTRQLQGPHESIKLDGVWTLTPGFDGVNSIDIKIINNEINRIQENKIKGNMGRIIFFIEYFTQKIICIKLHSGEISYFRFFTRTGILMDGKMNDDIPVTWRRVD